MSGTELVYMLFSECRPGNSREGLCIVNPGSFNSIWPVVRAIGVAMIVKAALTVVTFGIKLPAGIFIPTLGVGACAGRILGIGMQWLQLQHPDAILFNSCKGDLNCTSLLCLRIFGIWIVRRYRSRPLRDGWRGRRTIWCYGKPGTRKLLATRL